MNQWIALLDCNNFFASCERLFRPDLRRRPVIVLSSNDGCVVARSAESKQLGVPMGVPYFQIKDLVKEQEIAVFSSNFTLYRDISRRVMEVLEREMTVVEQYSIDEAFFQLEGAPEAVETRGREIKALIEREVGIPVSVGIARTKTQAKCANASAKTGTGVCLLTDEEWRERTPTLSIGSIWGVGGRLSVRYGAEGISTIADLLGRPVNWSQEKFGVVGARLWHELSGAVAYPLSPTHDPQKSLMSSRSFANTITDPSVIEEAVLFHMDQASGDLRRAGLVALRVAVFLGTSRHGDYRGAGGSAERVLATPTGDLRLLMEVVVELTRSLWQPGIPYKKAGVVLSGLRPTGSPEQLSMLESPNPETSEAVTKVYDLIKFRFGERGISYGRIPKGVPAWGAKRELVSPTYTTSWLHIPVVKA